MTGVPSGRRANGGSCRVVGMPGFFSSTFVSGSACFLPVNFFLGCGAAFCLPGGFARLQSAPYVRGLRLPAHAGQCF